MREHRQWISCVWAVGACVAAGAAPGQQGAGAFTLEEVVVTARKVEERLQQAPVAVSAFTGEDLTLRNAIDIADVAAASPNVFIDKGGFASGAANNPVVFIRGIGLQDFLPTIDPGVGIYLDGVYMARNLGNLADLVDLERAEVLRGPQGIVFGRNTIGGAVNLISVKPHTGRELKAELTIGEQDQYQARIVGNMPITDELYGRVSGYVHKRDGYVDLVNYDDVAYGDDDTWTVRGQLRWEPSPALTVDLALDYTQERETGAPLVLVATDPNQGGGLIHNSQSFINGQPVGVCGGGLQKTDPRIAGAILPPFPPIVPGVAFSDAANAAGNPACFGDVWISDDPFESNALVQDQELNAIEPVSEFDIWGFHVNVEWETPIGTLTSLTAYRGFDSEIIREGDGSPHFILQNNVRPEGGSTFDQEQYSQELRLNGSALDAHLDWLVGFYAFTEEAEQQAGVLATLSLSSLVGTGFDSQFPILRRDDSRKVRNTEFAGFAEGTLHFTDRLHLSAGVRFTDETKEFKLVNQFLPQQLRGEISVDAWTPSVSLSVDLTDGVMAYVSYSEGFRSGGFPGRIPNAVPGNDLAAVAFGPEFVKAVEGGLKAELFQNRLRANLAVFNTDYEDFQVSGTLPGTVPPVPAHLNLGNATINGVELELKVLVTQQILVDLALGYLDAEIDEIAALVVDDTIPTEENQLPYTPEWTWDLGASYNLPLPNGGELLSRVDWIYTDEQFYDIGNFDASLLDSYSRVNASVTYRHSDERWELTLGARNLTDDEYFTNGIRLFTNCSCAMNVIGRPRQVFGTVRYSFF